MTSSSNSGYTNFYTEIYPYSQLNYEISGIFISHDKVLIIDIKIFYFEYGILITHDDIKVDMNFT